MQKSIFIIGLVLLLWSPNATAQARPALGSCAADIKAQCKGVEPGQGRLAACLKEHVAGLSEPCQVRLAKVGAVAKACGADIKKSCADVKRGHGRIEACLKSALGNLSDSCKAAIIHTAVGGR